MVLLDFVRILVGRASPDSLDFAKVSCPAPTGRRMTQQSTIISCVLVGVWGPITLWLVHCCHHILKAVKILNIGCDMNVDGPRIRHVEMERFWIPLANALGSS